MPSASDPPHQWTIGVEEEFFLLDPETLDAADAGSRVLRECNRTSTVASAEMQDCTVEVQTSICADAVEALDQLQSARAALAECAASEGCSVLAAAVHPFAEAEHSISEGDRYREVHEQYGWVARQSVTCGQHVHVAVPQGQRAIDIHNELRLYAPLLLAMSANSPYISGQDTGLNSVRSRLANLYPRQAIPPSVVDWTEWKRQLQLLKLATFVHGHCDLWWAVRLQPNWGTVEVRVCDVQMQAPQAAAIAALVQALCVDIDRRACASEPLYGCGVPDFLLDENLWSASRSGLDGTFIDVESLKPSNAEPTSIVARDALRELVTRLKPLMVELGSAPLLPVIDEMLVANGADRQRQLLESEGSLRGVVACMSELFLPSEMASAVTASQRQHAHR